MSNDKLRQTFGVPAHPGAGGLSKANPYTIRLDQTTIASASAVTEAPAAFGGTPARAHGLLAHELTHTLQQRGGSGGGAETTLNLSSVKPEGGPGLPLDMAVKAKIGRPVTVEAGGKTVAKGVLKGMKRTSPVGDSWQIVIEKT